MVVGCQPYAPAACTPRKYIWYPFLLEAESTPRAIVLSEGFYVKNPLTPAGIVPANFRFVAQYLNRCATAVPVRKMWTEGWSLCFQYIGLSCTSRCEVWQNLCARTEVCWMSILRFAWYTCSKIWSNGNLVTHRWVLSADFCSQYSDTSASERTC